MAMTENDKIAKYGPIVQCVKSRETGEEYEIRLKDGLYSCNCKGFVFNKEAPKTCKHIKLYLATVDGAQKQAKSDESHQELTELMLKKAGAWGVFQNAFRGAELVRRVGLMASTLAASMTGQVVITAEQHASEDSRMLFID